MATVCEDLNPQKTVYTNTDISPFVFDLFCAISNIKKTETVDSLYINSSMIN